jgi:hypothetical protein
MTGLHNNCFFQMLAAPRSWRRPTYWSLGPHNVDRSFWQNDTLLPEGEECRVVESGDSLAFGLTNHVRQALRDEKSAST